MSTLYFVTLLTSLKCRGICDKESNLFAGLADFLMKNCVL